MDKLGLKCGIISQGNLVIVDKNEESNSTENKNSTRTMNNIDGRKMPNQILDSMDLEKERGITIKAQTVQLSYLAKNHKQYVLNLIDTPGHVDFSYEVSRSLYACEGSILIVDSTQGVEAQTLASVWRLLELMVDTSTNWS